jgi:hypothetical protein
MTIESGYIRMPELVQIQFATAEYQARFERPHVAFVGHDWTRAFEAVFTALLPFNLLLANTEIVNTGKLVDNKAIYRIPERGISFQFGAEEYRFSKDAASWATAEDDGQILLAAERALMEGSGAKIASFIVTVAMHLQPLTKPREEILSPFIPEPFKVLMTQRQTHAYGNHFIFADGNVLLDFSVAIANGIFVRFSSHFNGHPPLSEVLAKVRSDQIALFGMLGVEEAVNA